MTLKLTLTRCAFYCGGSHAIKNKLQARAKDLGIGFQAELFDW